MRIIITLIFILLNPAFSLENPGSELSLNSIKTQLGTQLDLNLQFSNSNNQLISLGEILNRKTSIIVPAYFGCPRLCGLVLDGTLKLINQLNLVLGTDFQVLSFSFDPKDTPKNAAKFEEKYRAKIEKTDSNKDFLRFFVGSLENSSRLMNLLGFGFQRDQGEFAHAAAIYLISPEGRISQYYTGINFSAWDVRLGLIDASKGSIGTAIDHVLLYCFRFDETKGKYIWVAMSLMRIGGAFTLLLLVTLFISLKLKERNRV